MPSFTRQSIKITLTTAREHGRRPTFEGADLSHLDLSRMDLNNADFRGANFRGANLIEANLGEADLSQVDLSQADLIGANLQGATLRGAHLAEANLISVNLVEANLVEADLRRADLSGVNLNGAEVRGATLRRAELIGSNLMGADLRQADLSGADLSGATLIGADLQAADLSGARLIGTDLSEAVFGYTKLLDIDLRQTIGLEMTSHQAPSALDLRTLYRSKGVIPDLFLIGLGAPDTLVEHAAAIQQAATPYYACFLSYVEADEGVAYKLFTDLQRHGVRCWLSDDEARATDLYLPTTDASIYFQDKQLLIFSERSLATPWVVAEVEAALKRERRLDEIVLFPLRLDEAMLTAEADWLHPLQSNRNIHDFSGWQTDTLYQKSLARLLRHLQARHK